MQKNIVTFSGPGPLGPRRHPPPFVDLLEFKILSLNLDIGLDAIGPEADFTIVKNLKSGHQVVTNGYRVVTKWSSNSKSPTPSPPPILNC